MFNRKCLFSAGSYRWYYGWNLFWWKIEGCNTLNGLNVYPPKDPNSMGFILRVHKYQFRLRWSKRAKKWFCGIERSYYA
jgi:hypothetical protein